MTAALRRALRAEIRRTGVTARILLADASPPPGLTARDINRWLGGLRSTAPAAHVTFTLNAWARLPAQGQGAADAAAAWVDLTAERVAGIARELDRTGLTPRSFLDDVGAAPRGLAARSVRGWLHGHAKTARGQFLSFVLARLAERPDGTLPLPGRRPRRPPSNRQDHLPITPAERAALQAELARTGIGGTVLLRSAPDKPAGLSAGMISGWLGGSIKTARPHHLAYVLARYAARTDAPA